MAKDVHVFVSAWHNTVTAPLLAIFTLSPSPSVHDPIFHWILSLFFPRLKVTQSNSH